ncbi:hypothetical protein A2U01_0114885, partial [Trifolium medium]|nr:hypothetical protein [Trifolium medium]
GNSSTLTPPSSFNDANIMNISACSFNDSDTSFPLINCKFFSGFGNTTTFSQQLI